MFSYLSTHCVPNTTEHLSHLNPRPIMLSPSIIPSPPPPSPRQSLNSPKPCSDVVPESPSTPFPLFPIAITTPPASTTSSDPEIIIIPSSIIYSRGYQ